MPSPPTPSPPTLAATGPTGSPVLTAAAAGATVRTDPPNSRRAAANADHANGTTAGPSPAPPPPNHANTFPPSPLTRPEAADITGAEATGGATTSTTGTDTESEESPIATSGESATATPESATSTRPDRTERSARGIRADASSTPASSTPAPAEPAPAELERDGRVTDPARTPEDPAESPPTTDGADAPNPEPDPRPRTTAAESLAAESSAVVPPPAVSAAPDPPRPARPAPRDGADDFVPDGEPAESEEPVDPDEPVVSANATGNDDANAEPTPNATANAPTRPTYRA